MILWMKEKLTATLIATVAVATVAVAGAVWAAADYNPLSPYISSSVLARQGQWFDSQGVIRQVTFDRGTTRSGRMDFLPNGKQVTVTVAFTTATEIEVGGGQSDTNQGQGATGAQPSALQGGMNANVEGTLQTDGSVLAEGIRAGVNGTTDNDGANTGTTDNDGAPGQDDSPMVGVIQSVDQGTQTFVLLADGQTSTVTIAFDAQTSLGDEPDEGGSSLSLVAGAHVRAGVVTRADGSLYAQEVEPAFAGNEPDGGASGN